MSENVTFHGWKDCTYNAVARLNVWVMDGVLKNGVLKF
jgi:hypothetical protein